ncbi:phosphoribosylglycinamide formyltransferase [Clostridiaceae bacterium DONG20-135]|uniref:Phosphoribosylglycinamide formyltransferase n=1 Tax=Copranaerobaculum intestinale TaxID=2692629 RepID=A0A6N8U306_9FIRM|nr:phosphoribosylglycinamide formyltransferase [Copranaerobaculum intestinale]MXQ72592.1 phosphoribosylglycinamide formyltransferase [Copranaerobaculum intestinale]
MVKFAVFASGSGTNFENIIHNLETGNIQNAKCVTLIVDKAQAKVIDRAKRLGIAYHVVLPKEFADKEAYEQAVLEILKKDQVELIILAGYMRIITHVLLDAYPKRIINLHPAYLPEFPGKQSILDAYEAKVTYSGVTVHYIDEGIDTGEIIRQEKVMIDPSWSLETLEEHIHALEYQLFPEVINLVCKQIEERR